MKTKGIIGFWRSITIISFVRKWEDWIRFLRQWHCLLALEKPNSVVVITKKCRKNITHSQTFYCSSDKVIMVLMTQLWFYRIWTNVMFNKLGFYLTLGSYKTLTLPNWALLPYSFLSNKRKVRKWWSTIYWISTQII